MKHEAWPSQVLHFKVFLIDLFCITVTLTVFDAPERQSQSTLSINLYFMRIEVAHIFPPHTGNKIYWQRVKIHLTCKRWKVCIIVIANLLVIDRPTCLHDREVLAIDQRAWYDDYSHVSRHDSNLPPGELRSIVHFATGFLGQIIWWMPCNG